jgi:hypothetical protein
MQVYLPCALIGFLGILATGCSVFGIRTFETAGYEVILKDGRFEIRQYPDALVAETVVDADYGKAGSVAFRRLAGYIFGGNKSKVQISMTTPVIQEKASERIAMTAPVMQEKSGKGWRMTFVLPAKYTMETVPEPLETQVVIRKQTGRKVAVTRYSGWLSEASMERNAGTLKGWIEQKGYKAASPPRMAAYDPPWTVPFLRRNELHIDIE